MAARQPGNIGRDANSVAVKGLQQRSRHREDMKTPVFFLLFLLARLITSVEQTNKWIPGDIQEACLETMMLGQHPLIERRRSSR